MVKWSNPGNGVEPSSTPWCSRYRKKEPSGHPRLCSPTLLTLLLSSLLCSMSALTPELADGLQWVSSDFDDSSQYTHHHHHHVVPLTRISQTLSRHFSLSFIASGWSSELHPVSSHSCCMYVRASRPSFPWPYVGVHRSTSLMNSSLLL